MNRQNRCVVVLVMGVVLCLAGLAAPAPAATIAGGFYHSLALKADGSVLARGMNVGGIASSQSRPRAA
jgi:hypothetical protein